MISRDRTHLFCWLAVFAAVLAVIVLRAPAMVLMPALILDEGAKVFAYFYEHRDAGQLLRFKSGYLPLIGNLIGYSAVRLPTRLIPFGFAGSAVLITSLAYSLFFVRGFRRWIPSDFERAAICLLLALAPVSDCLLLTTSDYSLWNLLGSLILLTALEPSRNRAWRIVHGLACNLLVWAHPLSLVIAPVVVWRAFRDREDTTFYRILLFNLIVHQVFGVSGILTTHGLWDHGTGIQIDVSLAHKFVEACRWTIQIVLATAFRTAFGPAWFERAGIAHPILGICWIVLLAGTGCLIARKVPRVRSLLFFLLYFVASLTFLSCFLRYEDVHDDPIAFITYSPRYIYLQSLAFLVLFGVLLSGACELLRVRRIQLLGWAPVIGLLCYFYLLNVQLGYTFVGKPVAAGRYYDLDPRNGPIVRDFFDRLDVVEKTQSGRNGIQLSAAKINDWPIIIDTTVAAPLMEFRMNRRARIMALLLTLVAASYATRRWWMAPILARYRQS